jgi:chromosomal replication initiator protein
MEGLETTESLLAVIDVIAEKIHSNIRELEGAFNRVIAHATLTGKKINKEFAKDVLKDVFSSKDRPVTPDLVKKYVCKHFNIKQSDIESAKRSRNFAFPRQIAMYICRDMTPMSLPKIGEAFGNRDHTTVLHACDKITGEIKLNESLKEIVKDLEKSIAED